MLQLHVPATVLVRSDADGAFKTETDAEKRPQPHYGYRSVAE